MSGTQNGTKKSADDPDETETPSIEHTSLGAMASGGTPSDHKYQSSEQSWRNQMDFQRANSSLRKFVTSRSYAQSLPISS